MAAGVAESPPPPKAEGKRAHLLPSAEAAREPDEPFLDRLLLKPYHFWETEPTIVPVALPALSSGLTSFLGIANYFILTS